MERRHWIGVGATAALVLAALLGVHAASRWLSADARAIRECPATYWTCESHVSARPRIEGLERAHLFAGEARHCAQFKAWEASVHRALFECQVSSLVESGSCQESETTCDLTGDS